MSTEINTLAPVKGAADAEIDAAPELVWDVLTALESWPSWNPDIRSIAVDSPLREGTTFRWKAGPATIPSTVRDVDAPTPDRMDGEDARDPGGARLSLRGKRGDDVGAHGGVV